MKEVIDVGTEKQLFIDNRWFFEQRGMTLTVNPPVKTELVMVPETPWERKRVGAGTIVEHEGRYLMFYTADRARVPIGEIRRYWADSIDGILGGIKSEE